MKVLVLGAYGRVGIPAIKLLAQSDLVAEFTVAGRSLERSKKAAALVGDRATALQVDGTDQRKLTSLCQGHDIIVNAADNSPVLPCIRAALRSGAHYCDASWGGILDQALKLESEAKAAGITAIIANGIAPGITNLMGVYGARLLDEVDQLQIGRADIFSFRTAAELSPQQWHKDPEDSLATLREFKHFIAMKLKGLQEEGAGTALDCQDGRWVGVDPITAGLEIPLLEGGTRMAFPFAAGRDIWRMLPRDLTNLPSIEVQFSPLPAPLHALLREQALRVLEDGLASDDAVNAFYYTVERDPHRWLTLSDDWEPQPKMWERAVGQKESRAARSSCWLTAPMWDVLGWFLTSVALVVAVHKILSGEIRERGVMTAEKAFEPSSFFDEVVAMLPNPPPDGRLIDESFEWLA